jgi:hypothetical protein
MHEIITLQLGQRANYLATHFWNTQVGKPSSHSSHPCLPSPQESYFTYSSDQESLVNHDIHFRPGIGADGTETFTPRTLIYDLKGGFGSLKKINALYELDEPVIPDALWYVYSTLDSESTNQRPQEWPNYSAAASTDTAKPLPAKPRGRNRSVAAYH